MQEVIVKLNKVHGEEIFELNMPSSWEELTREQFLYVSKYRSAWQNLLQNNQSLLKARCMLFLALSGLNLKRQKRLCEALSFVDENTDVNILDSVNFIFSEIKLTKNLMPVIPVGLFKRYYGPADKLADLTIDEFSFAFHCFAQYNKTGNNEFLLKLTAVLYRPKNKKFKMTGELREEFNNKMVPVYEKKLKRSPDEYFEAVYLYFYGCLEFLEKAYDRVFTRGKQTQRSGGSFMDAILAVSGTKFGPFEKTKKENLYIILKELQEMIIRNEREEKK